MRKLLVSENFPIAVLIIINLGIGVFLFKDYGESWDEQLRYNYAERSLMAYTGADKSLIDEKGAFYVMIAKLGSELLQRIDSSLNPIEAWHYIHFLSFVLGLFFLYKLCLNFLSKTAAFGTVLLFNTQPLLWGHAFINPKDIPFMAFFLGSIALGFELVENFSTVPDSQYDSAHWGFSDFKAALHADWQSQSLLQRFVPLILGGSAIVGLLVLIIFAEGIRDLVAAWIRAAADPSATGLLGWLFSRLAENRSAISIDLYIQKAQILYSRFVMVYLGCLLVLLVFLAHRLFPHSISKLWRRIFAPIFTSSASSAGKSAPLDCRSFFGSVLFHSHTRPGFCSAGKPVLSPQMQMEGSTRARRLCRRWRAHNGSNLALPVGSSAPKYSTEPICRLRVPLGGEGPF